MNAKGNHNLSPLFVMSSATGINYYYLCVKAPRITNTMIVVLMALLTQLSIAICTNISSGVGFNVETVEYKNISFTVWDVGGQDKVYISGIFYV